MEHRWGSGWTVGRRITAGAVVALALVAPAGAAFADDPLPTVRTPAGVLLVGDQPDGLGAALGAAGGPAVELPTLGVVVDPGPVNPTAPAPPAPPVPPLPPSPPPAMGGGSAGEPLATSLVWRLLPALLGAPGAVLPSAVAVPVGLEPPPCVPGDVCALTAPGAAHPLAILAGGQLVPLTPAVDAVGAAVGAPRMDVMAPVPPVPVAPAGPGTAARSDPRASGPPPLASTGSPIVAALAGLVLLAVGGFLTWARARG
ncbi:MAG TPA: hypothetical protein VIC57_02290 [Candidatus Dormibacteraeota bacterium]